MDGIPHERTLAKIALTIGVAVAGVAVFYATAHRDVPYKMVDELTAADDGKELRVHGWIAAGSIVDGGNAQLFVLQKSGTKVTVVVQGARNDCMRDQREVVAKGTLRDGIVQAHEVVCRCGGSKDTKQTSKFE